jgi:hypothetical protein
LGVAEGETVVAIDRTLDTTSPCEWLVWTKEDRFDLEQVFGDKLFHIFKVSMFQSFNVSKYNAIMPLVSKLLNMWAIYRYNWAQRYKFSGEYARK